MKEDLFQSYIEEVISFMDTVEMDASLSYIDEILRGKDEKSIIDGGEFLEECYKFLNEKLIFVRKYQYGFYMKKIEQKDVVEGASALKTAKYFIIKGIKEGDIKGLLEGIMIFDYFNLSFDKLLDMENISIKEKKVLSVKLGEILSSIKVMLKNTDEIPYNEKLCYEEYEHGLQEKNMKKVYDFIEVLERGRGYYLNGVIRGLIQFTSFFNSTLLKNVLCKKTSPLEIAVILDVLEEERKLSMALGNDVKNEWVLIEVIRQVLGGNRKQHLTDDLANKIKLILGQLKNLDEEFFFQSIDFFGTYEDFNYVLGSILAKSDREIILKYINTFKMTHYRYDENDRLFIESFLREASEENSLFLCSKMYQRWNSYLKDLIKEKKFVQDLVYTNCFYMVVYYFLLRKNEQEDVLQELKSIIKQIEEIYNIWCENSTEFRTRFFTSLTCLYLLSIECKEKSYELNDDKGLADEIKIFLKDKRIWLYYFDMTEMPPIIKEMEKVWFKN
ncbi:MAG: hypothetical protein NUV45_08270 [Tepidanaerobacteraceae bacterium]|nr:hypothetical protein [Tepidanaerobacteraceae bacterium]